MAEYNVTRDIRKLAEEAERNKTQDLTLAGLGLGGGFVASQTGGSAKNPNTKPTQLQQQIAQNDAQNRANAKNQGRTKTSTPKTNTEFKIDRRTKEGKKVVQEVVDQFSGNKPPVVKDDPLPNTGTRTRTTTKPTGFRGKVIDAVEGAVDFGKNLGKNLKTPVKEIGGKTLKKVIPIPGIGGFGVGQLITDYTGLDEAIAGKINIDQGMQDYFSEVGRDKSRRTGLHKIADATHDLFNLATQASIDAIEFPFQTMGATYDFLTKQPGEADINPFTRTIKGEDYDFLFDDVSASGAGAYARKPNPQMQNQPVAQNIEADNPTPTENVSPESPTIALSDRSELEKQIMANQEGGQPLLAGTFENEKMNQAFGGEGIPSYQANFLKRIKEEEPITDQEFQSAQQFALRRGLVFDPKEGYSKAQFFGQMFKGQTIGQFLRGEDAPLGFTDTIPETQAPGTTTTSQSEREYDEEAKQRMQGLDRSNISDMLYRGGDRNISDMLYREGQSNTIDSRSPTMENPFVDGVRRSIKREIGRDREIIEAEDGSYVDAYIPTQITSIMMKPASKRTDKENKRLANWASSTQGKGMGGLPAVKRMIEGDELTAYQRESLARSDRSADLAERRFQESIRQYKEGVERGQEADDLANLYKKVQILGLINNLESEEEKLGFDLDPDVINDYVGVLEEFGVEYDPETNIYKRKGKFGFGKQLSKEELAELSPLLEETKFIKLLEFTSKNNQ